MSQPLLIAFVMFAVVMFFSPGPNNVMLMASGGNFGFRRSVPHIASVTIGFAFMVAAVGVALGAIFSAFPALQTVLKYAGAAYPIYLAGRIAMSDSDTHRMVGQGRPMGFWGAALFQWVDAKGWVMVIGTITAYAAIASFPRNVVIRTAIGLVMGRCRPLPERVCGKRAAAGPELAQGRAGLQHRDGRAAVGLALSGLHGRRTPPCRNGFPLRLKML